MSTLDFEPYLITTSHPTPMVKRGRLSAKQKHDNIAHDHINGVMSSCHDDKQRVKNGAANKPTTDDPIVG